MTLNFRRRRLLTSKLEMVSNEVCKHGATFAKDGLGSYPIYICITGNGCGPGPKQTTEYGVLDRYGNPNRIRGRALAFGTDCFRNISNKQL